MPAHVLLTTYDTLRQDSEWLCTSNRASFDLAILDEAQRIKNRSSGMSQAVRSLDCRYKWALTGTPIENRISELASIFAFLKPGVFPGYEVSPNHAKRLIAPYFLRRRKEDVLTDLPAKEEFPVWLRLGEEQQNTYDKMERDGVVALQQQGKTITAQSIVTLIGELRKICNRDPVTGASAKLDWLRENLADVCESGDKVLVFTQYRQAEFGGSDWLQRELSDYGTLNYSEGQTDKHKEQILTAFERDPEKRIFIGHPRTAGLGLNQLVAANYVVHYDHWWNPAVTNQATARAHRPKQTKRVFVYHLWVVDTIEKLILDRTMEKQRLYDDVIDSLSVELSGDVLFDIYDDLLKKHGFRPIERSTPTTGERCVAVDLDPREFELLVGRLFEKLGYATRVTPYSRDGGVDIIAKREVGSSIEKLAIQCKYQSSPVGRPVLQQLLGVVSADPSYTRGVLVTNADVSMETLELVRSNGRLQLVTGPELEQLLSRYDLKKR
jgi:SNF2 family DNA or RNA helicase